MRARETLRRPSFSNNTRSSVHLVELLDFNHDGFIDLLTANGDNGEYVSPHKNYHGIPAVSERRPKSFEEKWFFPLNGAYKAMAADFDQDGDLDIAAFPFFPTTKNPRTKVLSIWRNRGGLLFDAHTFPESTTGRWVTMDVGDVDGDGMPTLFSGH